MFYLVNILTFLSAVVLVFAVHGLVLGRRGQVSERLSEIQKIEAGESKEEQDELQKPFFERLIRPFLARLGETIGNLTPRGIRENIEKKIIYAGNPYNINFYRLVTLQVLLALVLALVSLAVFALSGIEGERTAFLSILMGVFGFLFPVMMINTKAKNRQQEIQKSLPDALDLLLVSVEAGLGFDMALKRVSDQAPGSLSREIVRALEEIRMGKTREEALRGIVRRTGVADLSTFITAIIQAEQLGTNIANTLRAQAATMRQRRRQRAEQAAMKAPIKMLFPLVFFIFPALFVVLLGPAIIQFIEAFSTLR